MSESYGDVKQPKSIIYHPSDFISYMQQTLGVVNFDQDYAHFFMSAGLFHSLIEEVNLALKTQIIGRADYRLKIKRKTSLNEQVVLRLNKVWHGRVYLHQKRDRNSDIIWSKIRFDRNIDLKFKEELLVCPPLELLNPITELKDKELGIRIRTQVPFKDAWWGYDHRRLITSGKMYYDFAEGKRAMIGRDEDILYSDWMTDLVSRDYFHSMISILTREWKKWKAVIFLEMHKIIEQARYGTSSEEFQPSKLQLIKQES